MSKPTFRLILMLVTVFVMVSVPFFSYPITDGDVGNWADSAAFVARTNSFLLGANDQAHGPLITWGSALFLKLSPHSFYMLNFFNLLMGLLACGLMYFFSLRFWKSEPLALFNTYLLSGSLMFVYLARTPMYDFPAAVLYFSFCGFYLLYIRSQNYAYLGLALLSIAVGSMSRFSICLGLMGITMMISTVVFRRSLWDLVKEGTLGCLAIVGINFPWFLAQANTSGFEFIQSFIYDNTGRFVKSTRKNAVYRADFYGFSLYVLVGLLPHTFLMMSSFFNRHFFSVLKKDRVYQFLLGTFLPCLILFSLSGHTKLGRYISYVFPTLIMLMGHYVFTEGLESASFRKRAGRMTLWTAGFIGVLVTVYWIQFSEQAGQSILFVSGLLFLLFSLLFVSYLSVTYFWTSLKRNAHYWMMGMSVGYMIFFCIIAYETPRTPFLNHVHRGIMNKLLETVPYEPGVFK